MRQSAIAMAVAVALLAAWPAVASGQVGTVEAVETQRFDDWVVYRHAEPGNPLCFAVASPAGQPGAQARQGARFYVSAWPRFGVRAEASVRSDVPYRRGSTVTVSIERENFILFTDGQVAYVADQLRELKLLDAMRKGSVMVVQGVLETGTQFRDTYSLGGITASIAAISQSCG